ncbi:MAG: hypothetical protein C4321_06235, partial [Chloroflexota bacterium]
MYGGDKDSKLLSTSDNKRISYLGMLSLVREVELHLDEVRRQHDCTYEWELVGIGGGGSLLALHPHLVRLEEAAVDLSDLSVEQRARACWVCGLGWAALGYWMKSLEWLRRARTYGYARQLVHRERAAAYGQVLGALALCEGEYRRAYEEIRAVERDVLLVGSIMQVVERERPSLATLVLEAEAAAFSGEVEGLLRIEEKLGSFPSTEGLLMAAHLGCCYYMHGETSGERLAELLFTVASTVGCLPGWLREAGRALLFRSTIDEKLRLLLSGGRVRTARAARWALAPQGRRGTGREEKAVRGILLIRDLGLKEASGSVETGLLPTTPPPVENSDLPTVSPEALAA